MATTMLPCWTSRFRGFMLRAIGLNIHPTADIASLCWFSHPNVTFCEGAGCNVGCLFDGNAPIHIGRNVRIGPRCCFYTTTHDVGPPEQRRGNCSIDRPISVGAGTWLHGSVLLQPGANVEPGSIVKGGTVVVRGQRTMVYQTNQ